VTLQGVLSRLVPSGTAFSTGEALTLAFTYATAGFAVSVLHVSDGSSPLTVMAAAVLVNSATSTLAFAAVIGGGGSLTAAVVSGWLVATRFGLFSAALAPRLWPTRWKRGVTAHLAFDPTVAFAQREASDLDARRVFVASGLWLCLPWWSAAALGSVVGNNLGDIDAFGFDAVLPAMLLAIVWRQLEQGWPVAVVAIVIALLLVGSTPGGVPVIVAGCAALLAIRQPRTSGEGSTASAGGDATC
jgi:predicted branched-subunit amino acid permease